MHTYSSYVAAMLRTASFTGAAEAMAVYESTIEQKGPLAEAPPALLAKEGAAEYTQIAVEPAGCCIA